MLLAFLVCPGIAQVADTTRNKNVLVIYDEQDKLPGLAVLDQSLRTTLSSASSVKVDVYSESLDRSRFQEKGYYQFLRDYFRQKYSRKRIDVIIAVMGPSLDFVLAHGEEISPGTPIVFCGVDRREIENRTLSPNTTGVLVKRDFSATLALALKVHPDTRKVIFIAGTSSFDKRLTEQAMGEFRSYEERVLIEYLTDFELGDLLSKVSRLPPDTIILNSTVFRDNTGKSFVPHEVVSLISQKANAPVYGFVDQYLGRGIVGGHLYSVEQHGNKAAELALRLLNGENAADIPIVEGGVNLDMFDWREMHKWGIIEERLPPDSIIRFREPTVWGQYKWQAIGAAAFIVVQSLLILWLLFLRARRRKALAESRRFAALAKDEHQMLNDVVSNVPGVVWESRSSPGSDKRSIQFVSGYVQKLFGYSADEFKAEPGIVNRLIVDEDREMYEQVTDTVFQNGGQSVVQFRCETRDGTRKWLETHLVGICDRTGDPVGLRGVTMDISESKAAEEKLIVKEQQLIEAQRLAQVGSWEWNPTTDDVTWSEEIYRIYGLDPTKPAASFEEHARLYTSESWMRLQSVVANMLQTGQPYEIELEILHVDGHHLWGSARGEMLRDGGNITVRGTLQDITVRKNAEEAMRESEARFRNIADSAPVLIWMSDVSPLITFVNQYCIDFTGLSEEEVKGEAWLDVVHDDDRQRCVAIYIAAYERREPFAYEFRLRRADGIYCWFYSTAAPRLAADGEFLGYVGTCVELDDRKKAEESLQAALAEINQLKNELHEENIYLKEVIKLEHNFNEIIGHSDALKYVFFKIEQVAPTNATVLITGETGTGKELVAHAIHSTSLRKDRPLVKVNCAALSASLIESELFGHERGAFTGASARKIGRFELADGATIFLDEVGEIPLDLQSKLLRVIQEGEFERLGSSKTIKADVRIIAATNRNLEREVAKAAFREDLLFRLNVFPITVPPLRERKDDIPELIEHFVNRFSKKMGKSIRSVSPAAVRLLCKHAWPGNIRELANVIERSVINTQTENLQMLENFEPSSGVSGLFVSSETLEDIERKHITQILDKAGWKIEGSTGAAQILGLNPSTLRTRMSKLGISKPKRDEKHFVGISGS